MGAVLKKTGASCVTGCSACRLGDAPKPAPGGLTGWRLVVSAFAVFLLPLALALGGAMLVGGGQVGRVLGALCGLIVGGGLGVVIARRVSRSVRGRA